MGKGAHDLNEKLKAALQQVSDGGKMAYGTSGEPLEIQKNPHGSLPAELMSYVSSLNDVDSWYSIMMSTLVGQLLNKVAKFQRPKRTCFYRELFTFFLFEVLSPRMKSFIPRVGGLRDIDTQRYAAAPLGASRIGDVGVLQHVARQNLIASNWDWKLMFLEALNGLPTLLVCMIIVDIGMGFKSDIMSFVHYALVIVLVGVGRYVKNQVLTNNPGRQQQVEIYRRAMLLGLSYEVVPKVKYVGTLRPPGAPSIYLPPAPM